MTRPISVLIVDDHPVVRRGLRVLLEVQDGIEVAGEAGDGATALALSKQRNFVPTIGVSMEESTLRRMCLYWGVNPIPGEQVKSRSELIAQIVAWGKAGGLLASKDRIILVTGTHAAGAGHNQVLVHEIP